MGHRENLHWKLPTEVEGLIDFPALDAAYPEPPGRAGVLCNELRDAFEAVPILCRQLAVALAELGEDPDAEVALATAHDCILDLSLLALRLANHAEELSSKGNLPPWDRQRVNGAGVLASVAWSAAELGTSTVTSVELRIAA